MRRDACHAGSRGKRLPARRVGVSRTWKGFGHEKSSISASDRGHHRSHCPGDTSSGAAGRLGWLECRSHARANCWYGDRWNSGRRPRPRPRLLLLPRSGRRLRSRILRPSVLYGVSIRSVIARCDAEVRTTKVAERSAAFFAAHESLVVHISEIVRFPTQVRFRGSGKWISGLPSAFIGTGVTHQAPSRIFHSVSGSAGSRSPRARASDSGST
jgi:hypothetical protein